MLDESKIFFTSGIIFIMVFLVMGFISCNKSGSGNPPKAKIIPKNLTLFEDTRVDNYYWLREKENSEVISYLKAENEYTELMTAHTKETQDNLYQEMVSRIKESDESAPVKMGNYYYYNRTEEGKQYSIYCRRKGSLQAPEEIILDENILAAGHKYFKLAVLEVSPNHNLLAYSTDTTGSETYTIYIKDLKTSKLFPDKIENTYYSLEWANDNQTFFYTTLDDTKRPFRLFRHRINSSQSDDQLIYEEPDGKYFIQVGKTKNQKYLLLYLNSMVTGEVHYMNADKPYASFHMILPRQQGIEYYVENHEKDFYILTNDEAENFRLVKAPVRAPGKKNWQTIIPVDKKVKLESFDLFKEFLVVYERQNGLKQIRVRNLKNSNEHYVEFQDPVYTYYKGSNPEFDSEILRFSYTSLVLPKSDFDYHLDQRTHTLIKQDEVLGGYNPKYYQSERILAESHDGTKVPISLVYKKGIKKDGSHPLFLYAYGSYGSSRDPSFKSARISLLDRGFIYAIAHVRGGGEMGRYWYEEGKLLNKKNTFIDFVGCAEHLVNLKYTEPERLVIQGGSAGGLLMGAVSNMRPDLFKIILAHVPWVDVITTMLDESIPLTTNEFEEWGNPKDKEYYDYMKSYSPYDNVEAKDYPHMLITAGLNDPRVQYWEPAKWTAKLRTMKTDENILILKTNMGAGHSGASGRYDYLKEIAFEYAFVFDLLGIKK